MEQKLERKAITNYEQPEWVRIILQLCKESGAYPIKREYERKNANQN